MKKRERERERGRKGDRNDDGMKSNKGKGLKEVGIQRRYVKEGNYFAHHLGWAMCSSWGSA
jgi:hypothetical protein